MSHIVWTLLACRSAPALPDVAWDVVPPDVAGTTSVRLSDYAVPLEPPDTSLREACAAGEDVRAAHAVDWAVVTVSDREIRLGDSVVTDFDGWRPSRTRGSLIWDLYEALRDQELRATTYGGACWGDSHDRVLLVVDREAPAALVSQVVFTARESGRRDVAFVVGGDVAAVPEGPVGGPLCGDSVEVEVRDGQVVDVRVEPSGGGRVSAPARWNTPTSAVAARASVASVAAEGQHPLDLRVAHGASMTFGELVRFMKPWITEHAPMRWTWHPTYDLASVVPWTRATPAPTRRPATERVPVLPYRWPPWGPCEDVNGEEGRTDR